MDFFTGNQEEQSRLLINDGNGKFQDASASLPDHPSNLAALFADVDGDGDLDLLVSNTRTSANRPGEGTRVYVNDRGGRFRDSTEAFFADAGVRGA